MTPASAGSAMGLTLTAVLALSGCDAPGTDVRAQEAALERGAHAIRDYGCGVCHRIPGIAGADGNVGPSLERVAARVYLAGFLPNTPENLAHWIRAPQEFSSSTAMPDMHVTVADAHAIATPPNSSGRSNTA